MIRTKRLPENIMELIPKAAEYLSSLSFVRFAYLFGGLARQGPRPLSDVDIAVFLSVQEDLPSRKLEMLEGLMDILKTDEIDLVVLNQASLPIRMRILSGGKLLSDSSPFDRHAYESLTMREYFDFSYIEKSILQRRFLDGGRDLDIAETV